MVLPVGDEAAQQVGAAQQRAVRRGGAAERHVVAAAGAGVAAVEHELLGAQAREARFLVERLDVVLQLVPVGGRMDVHLDHAGIGRHREAAEARIVGRRVALEAHRAAERLRPRDSMAPTSEMKSSSSVHRRQEDVEARPCAPRTVSAVLITSREAPGASLRGLRMLGGLRRLRGLALAERVAAVERILRDVGFLVLGQHLGQRAQRQAIADGRVALDRGTPSRGAAARASSATCVWFGGLAARDGLQRQHVAHAACRCPRRCGRPGGGARPRSACPRRARRRSAGRFASSRRIRHGSS